MRGNSGSCRLVAKPDVIKKLTKTGIISVLAVIRPEAIASSVGMDGSADHRVELLFFFEPLDFSELVACLKGFVE